MNDTLKKARKERVWKEEGVRREGCEERRV